MSKNNLTKLIRSLALCLLIGIACINVSHANDPVKYVHQGQIEELKLFAEKGGDLSLMYDYFDIEGNPIKSYLINYAYVMEQNEIFEWLLDRIKESDNYYEQLNNTLTLMVSMGDLPGLKRFIDLGADINSGCAICNNDYPLLYALQFADNEIIDYILSLSPDINILNENNLGVLHKAALGGHYDLYLKFVDQYNMDIWQSHPNENILFFAASGKSTEILIDLLDRMKDDTRFDPYITDEEGISILHYAALADIANIKIILDLFDNPDVVDNEGLTPLHFASEYKLENVKAFVAAGANVNITDNLGYNALHIACINGKSQIVKYLIEEVDMIIEEQTNDGYDAILLAVESGDLKTVQTIVENENFVWTFRREALRIAKNNKYKEIYKYIKEN